MFYGSRAATNVRDIPDGSEDEIMSDDDSQEDYVILSPDSDYDPDTDKENEDPSTPQIIPETDSDSEDDIPLTELVSKWNRNLKLKYITWETEDLVMTQEDTKFLGNEDLPAELKEIESPYAFFEYFFKKEMLSDIVYQSMLYSMLGYYRIKIRSRRWYMRIFFHIVDLITVNAWILWRRNNKENVLLLVDFKMAVAECLCKANKTLLKKRGRPSTSLEAEIQSKKVRGPTADFPMQEVRTDGLNHLPVWCQERQRCKYPGCGGKSFIKCEKCALSLFLNKERNCYYRFHVE